MKHVCRVIRAHLAELKEINLLTIKDLKALHNQEGDRNLSSLRPHTKEGLLVASEWLSNNSENTTNIIDGFTDRVYSDLLKKRERVKFAKEYISVALGRPYCVENQSYFELVEKDKDIFDEVLRQVKDEVMVPNLKENCGNFDYNAFLDTFITRLHKLVGQQQATQIHFIVYADCQAGKTLIAIGIPQSLCSFLKIPMVTLTKNVAESFELCAKLKDATVGTSIKEDRVIAGELSGELLYLICF